MLPEEQIGILDIKLKISTNVLSLNNTSWLVSDCENHKRTVWERLGL